jgi:hypothetical protein
MQMWAFLLHVDLDGQRTVDFVLDGIADFAFSLWAAPYIGMSSYKSRQFMNYVLPEKIISYVFYHFHHHRGITLKADPS